MIFKEFFNQNADSANFFAEKYNIDKNVMKLILSRGIDTEEKINEYLHPEVFHDPFLLNGMKELVDRIKIAKSLGDKVLIFGDYDVDGVSATAIMLKALKKIGIEANYYLPNRYIDGYGLTCEVVDKIAEKYNPDLIITVDCGISCHKEVEYAKTKGIEIIVTDHHDIPDIIPDTIVIDAKIEGQAYPFKELCGTGVAYKIAQALLGEKTAEEFMPIACLATIADIVSLTDENRTIVTKGLKLFERYLPVGIKVLIKENKLSITHLTATDISFKIAPKLNASGRMGDAADSLKLYLETDSVKIEKYIQKIKEHNAKRQELCNKIYEDAEKALKKVNLRDIRVISLASKVWDQGVLGIVCSRLVEKYHKPVFLFAQVGDELHGSGRSIDDINIHELLSSLQDILETYGGHSMAAGLTLKREKYEEFSKRVNAFVFEKVDDKVYIPISYYDLELKPDMITDKFLSDLQLLEPVGAGNPRPKFKIKSSDVEIIPMKKFPQHANIKIAGLELVYFNFIDEYVKMMFSKEKSFIFELQNGERKGVVSDFDGGSFIKENNRDILDSFDLEQIVFEKTDTVRYNYYSQRDLLNFVTKTIHSIFGTAFVAYSVFDYINFLKTYSSQDIYYFGVNDKNSSVYNSVLLAPKGVEWAQNYSKIVFLTPVLEEGFISEINKITNAEIYLPIDKEINYKKFEEIDLSREVFGKIYSTLNLKQKNTFANIFELYDSCKNGVNFATFYSAILTFRELNLIEIDESCGCRIIIKNKEKMALTDSKIYNKIRLLTDVLRGEK